MAVLSPNIFYNTNVLGRVLPPTQWKGLPVNRGRGSKDTEWCNCTLIITGLTGLLVAVDFNAIIEIQILHQNLKKI